MKSELRVSGTSKYFAEGIGTFFLVLTVGCCVHTGSLVAALSIGSMLMVMVYAMGSVSGGHFNPAVTLAVLLSKRHKITPHDALFYMMSQVAGSILAALLYWWIFRAAFFLQPQANYSSGQAAALEIFFTGALCYVVLNVATTTSRLGNGDNGFFGMAIGFTVVSSAIAMGGVSGCSLNPAVSIGAIFAGYLVHGTEALRYWALYTFCPFAGALVGFLGFWMVQGGFTQRYEFPDTFEVDEFEVEDDPPMPDPEPVVVKTRAIAVPPQLPPSRPALMRKGSVDLFKGSAHQIPAELHDHELVLGLKWRVRDLEGQPCDLDSSCVKYDNKGRSVGAIYFAMKSDETNGIFHSGDELAMSGIAGTDAAGDNERIYVQLSRVHAKVHCLFFVVQIFSSGGQTLGDVEELAVRVMDKTDDREYCRFDKRDISSGNSLVVAMLYRSQGGWWFKPIDESHTVRDHGTYRDMEPFLKPFLPIRDEAVF